MTIRGKAAAVSSSIVALISVVLGSIYLFSSQFMPYHADALGTAWAALEPAEQTRHIVVIFRRGCRRWLGCRGHRAGGAGGGTVPAGVGVGNVVSSVAGGGILSAQPLRDSARDPCYARDCAVVWEPDRHWCAVGGLRAVPHG